MSATIEELPTKSAPGRRPFVLRPSVREALWGYVYVGPWLIGLVLFRERFGRRRVAGAALVVAGIALLNL